MPIHVPGESVESSFAYPIGPADADELLLSIIKDPTLQFPIPDITPRGAQAEVAAVFLMSCDEEFAGHTTDLRAGSNGVPVTRDKYVPSLEQTIDSLQGKGLDVASLTEAGVLLHEITAHERKLPLPFKRSTGDPTLRTIITTALEERFGRDKDRPFEALTLGPYIMGLAVQVAAERGEEYAPLTERVSQAFMREWRHGIKKNHYHRAIEALARDISRAENDSETHFDIATAVQGRRKDSHLNAMFAAAGRRKAIGKAAATHAKNMQVLRQQMLADAPVATPEPAPVEQSAPQTPPESQPQPQAESRPCVLTEARAGYEGYGDVLSHTPGELYNLAVAAFREHQWAQLLYFSTALHEQYQAGMVKSPTIKRNFIDQLSTIQAHTITEVHGRIDQISAGTARSVDASFILHMTDSIARTNKGRELKRAFVQGSYACLQAPEGAYQQSVIDALCVGYAYGCYENDVRRLKRIGKAVNPIVQRYRDTLLLRTDRNIPDAHRYVLRRSVYPQLLDTAKEHRWAYPFGVRAQVS